MDEENKNVTNDVIDSSDEAHTSKEESIDETDQADQNEIENVEEAEQTDTVLTTRQKIIRGIMELVIYVAIILICIDVIPRYVIQRTIVSGDSMQDTLQSGDNLMVSKISYRFYDPKRFDIIVFYPHGKTQQDGLFSFTKNIRRDHEAQVDDYYVKRIIGLPGETIQIIGSDIYINEEMLDEHYGKMPITDGGIADEPLTLGDDEYFVMGDNRAISLDSRMSPVGSVKRENIAGKAVFRIYPFREFGPVLK